MKPNSAKIVKNSEINSYSMQICTNKRRPETGEYTLKTAQNEVAIAIVYYIKIVKITVFPIFRVNLKILPEFRLLPTFLCDLGIT